jgi:hypothetical protein
MRKRLHMTPYRLQLLQKLKPGDNDARHSFCSSMQEKLEDDGFFLWGYVKGLVYVPPVPRNIDELKIRIRQAVETFTVDMLHRVWGGLHYRLDICRVTRGAHIEHL